ncbi:lysophosphatidylcholine acyltransferase 1 [Anaeramoeba flamelloides]|uniref:Lysophosphatidylcholine acyltransferase 1 n=1 Tax=Anaeramoeba flamelloides TaxID=1746091 RepID=A0ABQ8ZB36_9EUKA|nr:lysophosphatidylcholine acyltransferase 1 [Anaeramoeba flamelloides]
MKDAVARVPVVGTINTLTQGVYMNRNTKNSVLIEEIKQRYKSNDYIPLCVFSEGTTTNGKGVIMFKKGIFETGYTIHPICIKYKGGFPFKFTEINFTHQNIFFLVFSLFSNPLNYLEITYLDPYEPSQEEKEDPILFANNFRKVI